MLVTSTTDAQRPRRRAYNGKDSSAQKGPAAVTARHCSSGTTGERRKMGVRLAAERSTSTPKPECTNPRRVSCSAENASLLY